MHGKTTINKNNIEIFDYNVKHRSHGWTSRQCNTINGIRRMTDLYAYDHAVRSKLLGMVLDRSVCIHSKYEIYECESNIRKELAW